MKLLKDEIKLIRAKLKELQDDEDRNFTYLDVESINNQLDDLINYYQDEHNYSL